MFKRELLCDRKIELTSTNMISMPITFKQYDVGTSVLLLDTLVTGSVPNFSNHAVYITYSMKEFKFGEQIAVVDAQGNRVIDQANILADGRISINIHNSVIEKTGEVNAELIVVDSQNNRFTGPTLKFTISPSLVGNSNGEIPTAATCGEFLCGELLCGEGLEEQGQMTKNTVESFISHKLLERMEVK